MATLREYFDMDFAHTARIHAKLSACGPEVEVVVLYDFAACVSFMACYVPGINQPPATFTRLIEAIRTASSVDFGGKMTLPSARIFPGSLRVENTNPFIVQAQFFGEDEWISTAQIPASQRVFIYAESRLTSTEVQEFKKSAPDLKLQFRSVEHASFRSRNEKPLAFVSHDSRDKTTAREIAFNLQRLGCTVWYDEFSLRVGANLRESIETGLKNCRKCVLVLSPEFFANKGWTKREFDSIFTREILERSQLVLPVWCGVSQQSVFEYCPSLLNVKALDWNSLGAEAVCRELCNAIRPDLE